MGAVRGEGHGLCGVDAAKVLALEGPALSDVGSHLVDRVLHAACVFVLLEVLSVVDNIGEVVGAEVSAAGPVLHHALVAQVHGLGRVAEGARGGQQRSHPVVRRALLERIVGALRAVVAVRVGAVAVTQRTLAADFIHQLPGLAHFEVFSPVSIGRRCVGYRVGQLSVLGQGGDLGAEVLVVAVHDTRQVGDNEHGLGQGALRATPALDVVRGTIVLRELHQPAAVELHVIEGVLERAGRLVRRGESRGPDARALVVDVQIVDGLLEHLELCQGQGPVAFALDFYVTHRQILREINIQKIPDRIIALEPYRGVDAGVQTGRGHHVAQHEHPERSQPRVVVESRVGQRGGVGRRRDPHPVRGFFRHLDV
eukprot:Colp12_sorted_trinity150504_noHs@15948